MAERCVRRAAERSVVRRHGNAMIKSITENFGLALVDRQVNVSQRWLLHWPT
jgi:hypothetical protein